MLENLISLEGDSDLNLQAQLRQQIVDLVSKALIPPGKRLPSSRKLADHLGIARNTAVLAYQQLLDGDLSGEALWRSLNLASQLGVTRGTLENRHR